MKSHLERALPIYVAHLSEKTGIDIELVAAHEGASTDGQSVKIPMIGESSKFYPAIFGYADHESSHLLFSDFEAPLEGSPLLHSIAGLLEDGRCERALIGKYPGTYRNLDELVNLVKVDPKSTFFRAQVSAPEVKPATVFLSYICQKMRTEFLGQNLQSELEVTQQAFKEKFSSGVYTRLNSLLVKLPTCNSTSDVNQLAGDVLRMLEDEREQEQQEKSPCPDPSESSNQNDEQGAGAPNTDGSPEGSDPSATEPSDSSSDEDGSSNTPSQNSGGEALETALDQLLNAGVDESPDDALSDFRSAMFADIKRLDAHKLCNVPKAVMCNEVGDGQANILRIQSQSSALADRLFGLVQASRETRTQIGRSGRRISGKHLSRVVSGDLRIFKQREERSAPNTAVHLAVDLSFSMDAGKAYELASDAALALALALERIPGVNPAVTFFKEVSGQPVYSAVRHGESVRRRAACFSEKPDGDTPMAEAIWYAAFELIKQREPRKLLVVVTDGAPNSQAAAAHVITLCQMSSIEVIGIGIRTAVSHLFNDSIVINHVDELRNALFDLMRHKLAA